MRKLHPGQTLITMTGNEHARVSTLSGRDVRFRAILCATPTGPRFSRREFSLAAEARAYRRRLLARLPDPDPEVWARILAADDARFSTN